MLDLIQLAIFDPAGIMMKFLTADALTVYLLVFAFMVVESSFIPFPSEVIVPPAAYLACTKGDVNIVVVVVLATLGAIVGALINYFLSVWIGRPLVYRFANSRIGHACLIDENNWPINPGCQTANLHSGRTGTYERRQIHIIYRPGCFSLELRPRRTRLLAWENRPTGSALCQSRGIQRISDLCRTGFGHNMHLYNSLQCIQTS